MNTFLISDTHFGHQLMVRPDSKGNTIRPFSSLEEMNEIMIANWNSVVRPKDTVWHLGDVVINRSYLHLAGRLNGTKRLIMGNHDTFRNEEYLKYFKDVQGSATLDGMIMTHIPIHQESLERWGVNIHGHTHSNSVMLPSIWKDKQIIDTRYICVCVEQVDYTPISLEDLKIKIDKR